MDGSDLGDAGGWILPGVSRLDEPLGEEFWGISRRLIRCMEPWVGNFGGSCNRSFFLSGWAERMTLWRMGGTFDQPLSPYPLYLYLYICLYLYLYLSGRAGRTFTAHVGRRHLRAP